MTSNVLDARILVVEDDSVVARDIEVTLATLGYDVAGVVSTAEDAVDAATHSRPDLALMDIRLPGRRDGVEAGTALRERLNVPVVYLTAHSDPATLSRAKESGSYGYLVKPFDGAGLRAAIEVALYRHHTEELLRLSEEHLRAAIQGMTEGVVVTDAEGVVTDMNASAEGLLARPAGDVVGRRAGDVVEIVNEVGGQRLPDPMTSVLEKGVTVYLTGRTAVRARGGRLTPVAGSITPMSGDDGRTAGAVFVLRDATVEREMARAATPEA